MDTSKELLIIKGQDKSDSVDSYDFSEGKCNVKYSGSPKVYSYGLNSVRLLKVNKTLDIKDKLVFVKGSQINDIEEILDFGTFYRIKRKDKKDISCKTNELKLQNNCLSENSAKELFKYYKDIAEAVSLKSEDGFNILKMQYDRIKGVSEETVLANFLNKDRTLKERTAPETIIYPFGLNQSQKEAVENAFSSNVSIIQGPPGTGKTQTILNIIANAVVNGKTVAVVSNNNSATHNVYEKLEKKNLEFLCAFLGSRKNKMLFEEEQSGKYPPMAGWTITQEEKQDIRAEVDSLTKELNEMLDSKNRIAEIKRELLELTPEKHYFDDYYSNFNNEFQKDLSALTSKKILGLWLEYENQQESGKKLNLLQKIIFILRNNMFAYKIMKHAPKEVIPFLQNEFYKVKKKELLDEEDKLSAKLENYKFEEKMEDLRDYSVVLFKDFLSRKYDWRNDRPKFTASSLRRDSYEFNREYPIILSTTYSIKGTLDIDHIYDYLIVDEASQVDLTTGVLALSCAKNIVIVGDLMQLPNVITSSDIEKVNSIGAGKISKEYDFTTQSLLSSAEQVWKDAPSVLLREHYRCHPKIINFCNQKFYNGKLIVMTEDNNENDVLTMFKTNAGNHARGHINKREIDVIKDEVIPKLAKQGYDDIGIITPYRDQVSEISKELGKKYEVDTVHKYQGREKEAIVLTSVDNVITEFVDDPHMLNVAVSRAVKALAVVTSENEKNDKTNYGDLAKYIEYNNCEIINSGVYSVFDMLYKSYADERREFLKKHKNVSEYASENLMYAVIEEILSMKEFASIGCALHVSLSSIIKDFSLLTSDEAAYAENPLTHTDFLLFNRMDKSPVLAVEVDGTSFHAEGSKQQERDIKKNSIFNKINIPLLRIRTDESGEKERIEEMLKRAI